MLNPLFMEIANGTLSACGYALMFIIGRYLFDRQATSRGRAVALGIGLFIAGDTIIRSWVWLWRHQTNDGISTEWMSPYPVIAVGLLISVVGAFWMIRVFSFSRAPAWIWLCIAACTFMMMTLVAIAR